MNQSFEEVEINEIEFDEKTNQLLQWEDFFKHLPMVENSWRMNPMLWMVWKAIQDSKKQN